MPKLEQDVITYKGYVDIVLCWFTYVFDKQGNRDCMIPVTYLVIWDTDKRYSQ